MGCGGGLETPADTLERSEVPDSPFGYVIGSVPEGYELCAVTTPSAFSMASDPSASLVMYGRTDVADAYAAALIGVALLTTAPLADLPLGVTEDVSVRGTEARLGRTDGLLAADLPAETGRVLTFRVDDDRTVQVVVRGDDELDIVALAEGVELSDDVASLGSIPDGFEELGDLYQLEGRAQFRFALDHQLADDDGLADQVTLLGSQGDRASLEAFRFRAARSEVIDVNGAFGIAADIGPDDQGPFVVSWLAEDDLILRIFSFIIPTAELEAVAASVERVDGPAWDFLRTDFDVARCEF